jgi:vacuolar-type H+-ATPase subunit D/Vma8
MAVQRSLLRFTTAKTEVISPFGQILGESVKFKEVQEKLSLYLGERVPDKEICTRLGLTEEQLRRFRQRVKPVMVPPKPEELAVYKNREVEFWEFVRDTEGDIYLLSWFSFFQTMKNIGSEIDQTLHAVDKGINRMNIPQYHEEPNYIESAPTSLKVGGSGRGLYLLKPDLIRLLRIAFNKQYPKFIQDYVKESNTKVFAIKTLAVDKTTLLPPAIKGQGREPGRKIIYVEALVLSDAFKEYYRSKEKELEHNYSQFKDLSIRDAWEKLDEIATKKAVGRTNGKGG